MGTKHLFVVVPALVGMLVGGAVSAAAQATGYAAPGPDEFAAWDFQKAVGDVFWLEHASLTWSGSRDAALVAGRYDSSSSFLGTNCVSAVRNQGSCSSCWAFAATATLESAWCMEKGNLFDGAEQTILECRSDVASDSQRCAPSWEQVAYDVMRGNGIDEESRRPYAPGSYGSCAGARSGDIFYGIDGSSILPVAAGGQPSLESIKEAIVHSGAATIVVSATTPFMGWLPADAPVTNTDADLATSIGLHEVVVTGWDDALGAWRIKNSWDVSWGDGGFAWLSYNDVSIVGDHFATVTPRLIWGGLDQFRIIAEIFANIATYESLWSADPLVQWPTSLGFPAVKLTVTEGIQFALDSGIVEPSAITVLPENYQRQVTALR